MRLALRLCFLMMAGTASATTLPPVDIAELFKTADLVALVQVTSGEMLGTGKDSCGAKYTALVQDDFKGATKGETIEFGNYYGYEIGSNYVVFLTKAGRRFEPMTSTNSMMMRDRATFDQRCGPKINRNTVMHSGFGALRVLWTAEYQYKDAVRVPTRYVVLPSGTATAKAILSEQEEYSGTVWVKLDDMKTLLRGMAE